jgi:hypothetical protein
MDPSLCYNFFSSTLLSFLLIYICNAESFLKENSPNYNDLQDIQNQDLLLNQAMCSLLKLNPSQVWWFLPIILATQEVEIGRILVRGQPGQKFNKTPSLCLSSSYGGSIHGKIIDQMGLGSNERPYSKNNYSKEG